ncbi:hypothetical protein DFH28DRAFT_1097334 [Melampsora americana]|nr:hypothetical protein DFH28DRAFT_1097334 [Melampsora americana]
MSRSFKETGYLYRLFSHRFLCIFIIITTVLTFLQCWLSSRSLITNHNGAKLLTNIIFTMQNPEALNSTTSLNLRTAIQKASSLNTSTTTNSTSFILDHKPVTLTFECIQQLKKPLVNLDRNHRTNIATLVLQPWIWGLGIWALLLESVPHLAAVLVADLIITVFGVLDVHESTLLHEYFHQVVIDHCDGIDVLPMYWSDILGLDSACNATSYVSYKLYSVLDWRTFKKLGASRAVRIAHSFSLAFTVTLHLNAYFLVTFLSLWLDELIIHVWETEDTSNDLYRSPSFKKILIGFITLSLPWLFLGHWSLNHEHNLGLICFLVLDLMFLILGFFLLASKDSHYLTENWIFLKFTGATTCVLLFASLIFAIMCYVFFDKGILLQAHTDSRELGEDLGKVNMSSDDSSDCLRFPSSDPLQPDSYRTDSRTKYETGYSTRLRSPSTLESTFPKEEESLKPNYMFNLHTDSQLRSSSKMSTSTSTNSKSWMTTRESLGSFDFSVPIKSCLDDKGPP